MMQSTQYSTFDLTFKSDLEYVNSHCQLTEDTKIPDKVFPGAEVDESCAMGSWYTPDAASSCDSIAVAHNVSSAGIFYANQHRLATCGVTNLVPAGTKLCIPPSCSRIYQIEGNKTTCEEIENIIKPFPDIADGDVRKYNRWVGEECQNITPVRGSYGNVICLGPLFGDKVIGTNPDGHVIPEKSDGYVSKRAQPPKNSTVAEGTTIYCGKWAVAKEDDTCVTLCVSNRIPSPLFMDVNPSLGKDNMACTSKLKVGNAYCVGPNYDWKDPAENRPDPPIETPTGSATPTPTATPSQSASS